LLAVPDGNIGTGILGKWKYISNLDVFMGLQDPTQGNVWIYKPVGWQDPSGTTNLAPSVSITAPADGAGFTVGDTISVSATASDPDGTVAKVEFYAGSTKIGESTSAPYTYAWTTASAGSYALTAVATDNAGAQTASAPVNITVSPGGTSGTVTLQDGSGGYGQTRDTYLSVYAPDLAFGGTTSLQDQASNYSNLIRFAIFQSEGGPVPDGAVIQSATLSLYKFSYYNMTYGLNRMLVDWSESGATWNQREAGLPWSVAGANGSGVDYAAAADAQGSAAWSPGWVNFDVTAAVEQMSQGSPNYGWRLIGLSGNTTNIKRFHTREYATDPTLRPKLVISYSLP